MRILWLKTEMLHPVDKGGKIRTFQMLRQLKQDHRITYLTLDDGAAAPDATNCAEEYCHELILVPHRTRGKFSVGFYAELALNLTSPLPYFVEKYESPLMRQRMLERVNDSPFDVVVCDFLAPSINVPERIPCATLLFQHNVEAAIWKRHYLVQANPVKRAYLYDQWRKARAFERAACRRFDYVVAVSREDRETMRRGYDVQTIADVPTGVDIDYFRPRPASLRKPNRLVFTGSMDWLPNEDAIIYFSDRILPRIRQAIPDVTLVVVGRNPFPRLIELSRRDPSITVTGRVEDVRPYMATASAYVVPLRIGGGTRLKIFEAMAMGMPVISTSIGAEGLPVRQGRDLLLADDPDAFASSVVRVLSDERLARHLGVQAAATVRERFSWKNASVRFAEICKAAVDLRSGRLPTGAKTALRKVG